MRFSIKQLGLNTIFLSIQITPLGHGYFLNQQHYNIDLLYKAGLLQADFASNPLPSQVSKFQDHSDPYNDSTPYQIFAHSLQYLEITCLGQCICGQQTIPTFAQSDRWSFSAPQKTSLLHQRHYCPQHAHFFWFIDDDCMFGLRLGIGSH